LVLAGDGPADYVGDLQQRAQSQDSGNKVLFTGWLDGSLKVSALQNASLLALPSHHENFGLCVVEALVCGTPVLVSRHVNLAPKIQAAGAGWTTKLDAEEMKKTLTFALGDASERERRGRAGSELAKEFAWPQIAQTLHGLYQRVMTEKDSLVAN
jgi:glycosyltransferase involved in cell wall biosynthesis